jgi:hypothetical protein
MPNEPINKTNGTKSGILFRLGGELTKALVPKEVRSSHNANKKSPNRQIIMSVIVIGPKNSFAISRIFTDISFHNIENNVSLYYIRALFSREIDYG